MEQRIRDLCELLLATDDPVLARVTAFKLRAAIHEHIEELRAKLLEVPASNADLFLSNSDLL